MLEQLRGPVKLLSWEALKLKVRLEPRRASTVVRCEAARQRFGFHNLKKFLLQALPPRTASY